MEIKQSINRSINQSINQPGTSGKATQTLAKGISPSFSASMCPSLSRDGDHHCNTNHQNHNIHQLPQSPDSPKSQKSPIARWEQFLALPSPDLLLGYCHAFLDMSSQAGILWATKFMRWEYLNMWWNSNWCMAWQWMDIQNLRQVKLSSKLRSCLFWA